MEIILQEYPQKSKTEDFGFEESAEDNGLGVEIHPKCLDRCGMHCLDFLINLIISILKHLLLFRKPVHLYMENYNVLRNNKKMYLIMFYSQISKILTNF